MKKQINGPSIIFSRFNEDSSWKSKKFKELLNPTEGIRRGPFGSALKKELFVQNSEYVVYEQQNAIYDHFNTRYRISEEKYRELKKFILLPGDFIMSGAGTIGKISLVPEGIENGVFNQALIRLRVNKNTDKEFFLQWMRSPEMQNKLTKANPASAMVNLVPMSEVKEWDVIIPSPEEQSAIGSLFRTLDDLLVSYKDNLTNYQSLKAHMLSKMFPKAGQSVPEIRLDGFEGEWECLKIAEIFQIIDGDRGKSYPGESDFYSVGHTLFLDTGNVKKSGLDFSTTKFISEEKDKELRNGKLILGDFILTSRGTLGNVAYYNENIQKRYSSVRINSAMLILRPLLGDKISPDYILAVLRGNLISDFMKVNQVGSAQPHITKKEFSKIKVLVPSNIREQQAIGAYFSNLDNLINSYQEKISQLETLKKKLLQDMFI